MCFVLKPPEAITDLYFGQPVLRDRVAGRLHEGKKYIHNTNFSAQVKAEGIQRPESRLFICDLPENSAEFTDAERHPAQSLEDKNADRISLHPPPTSSSSARL